MVLLKKNLLIFSERGDSILQQNEVVEPRRTIDMVARRKGGRPGDREGLIRESRASRHSTKVSSFVSAPIHSGSKV